MRDTSDARHRCYARLVLRNETYRRENDPRTGRKDARRGRAGRSGVRRGEACEAKRGEKGGERIRDWRGTARATGYLSDIVRACYLLVLHVVCFTYLWHGGGFSALAKHRRTTRSARNVVAAFTRIFLEPHRMEQLEAIFSSPMMIPRSLSLPSFSFLDSIFSYFLSSYPLFLSFSSFLLLLPFYFSLFLLLF